LDAHKLIEDFMLLANRKVAELLGKPKANEQKKRHPVVYRIHDTPSTDKMNALGEFVAKFGYKMDLKSTKSTTASLNQLLKDVNGKKESDMIELLAVRSMPKAIYTTKNVGHYGLGFDFYTHFTSPIRRYPDVMVHRLLQAFLEGKTYSNENELENLSKHSSEMEKLAAEAERSSIKFKQVEYMEQFVGDRFRGMISGVTDFGIFVEIVENKCEGMIRMRDQRDDFYVYDEDNYRYVGRNNGKIYALGDSVWIEVRKADVFRKQLDFVFVSGPGAKNDEDDFKSQPVSNPFNRPEGKFSETNAEFAKKSDSGPRKSKFSKSGSGKNSGGSKGGGGKNSGGKGGGNRDSGGKGKEGGKKKRW
ncbi:MAG: RNB domain-containing ribonuclease, partial [Bacteroidia bacterium]|nr:RNB domain-containing ribonuclease [Bacteroidia bacterium]